MKRPQTLLSSCTGIIHRAGKVNARADGYPCRMGSEQSLNTMAAQRLDLPGQP